MDEYISRESAAKALMTHRGLTPIARLEAATTVCHVPAADVVEVVRCKDCEFNDDGYRCPFREAGWGYDPDRYCSFGERKEG